MGGRGGSSGISNNVSKPSYFKESEKAVQLKINVTDYDLEQTRSRTVWVPKSQLAENGRPSEWITNQKAQEFYSGGRARGSFEATWEDASGKKFSASKTSKEIEYDKKRQAKYNAGVKSYNDLVSEAKALGIKGARVGLKRSTLLQKINEAKSKK